MILQTVVFYLFLSDTGVGISKDKHKEIFERFHSLELSNKGLKEGHGVGLAVVKELIDKLNGKIDLKSELKKGATFIATLPFEVANISFFSPEWEKLHPSIRILVVCDKLTSTETQFKQFSNEYVSKTDSASLINKLEQAINDKNPYQVLIIDDEITTDPLEFINIIHKEKRFSGLMKLLSLHPKQARDKVWYDKARKIGCFDFLQKPLLPSELDKKMLEAWEKWQNRSIEKQN